MGLPAAETDWAPDPERVARFSASLLDLWPGFAADPLRKLGIAVSGGPDSVALLLLAAAAFPDRVEAATVDHGLRSQSVAEAAFAAQVSGRIGVPHAILSVEVAAGNLQAEARAARYAALGDWMRGRGITAHATAHHVDDQAETLLLRLNRGSGVGGLAGVRKLGRLPGSELALVRPLLAWRRMELAEIVASAGIEPVNDPSNADDRFDRARIRKELAGAGWLNVQSIAISAGHLADADSALTWAAEREWRECVRRDGPGITYRRSAPRAVALRVLTRIVIELGEPEPRGGTVARVFEALLAGRPASIGSLVARALPEGWVINAAPRRRTQ